MHASITMVLYLYSRKLSSFCMPGRRYSLIISHVLLLFGSLYNSAPPPTVPVE